MSIPSNISMTVGVADPTFPSHVIKPNADGSINIGGGGTGATSIPVTPGKGGASTGTVPTAVASNVAAVTLIAANTNRIGGSVYYDGAAILYLICSATTPTSTRYTIKMGAGLFTYFELPAGYTGIVQGIWSSAVGSALVEEYSA